MAEFIGVEEKAINAGDPLIFGNKTDCSYDVSAGIVFHKSGIYKVSIDGNKTTITKVSQKIQDLEQPDVIYKQAALDTMYKLGYRAAMEDLEQPEIIRCKDCKHRPIKKDNGTIVPPGDDEKCPCLCDDEFYSWIPRDDFFCANGERREE